MTCCPRCAGLMVNHHDDPRCLNCGHRPPTFTANPKPVLTELRCALCQRDRERGSVYCKQCVRMQGRTKKLCLPRFLKTHCAKGHEYTLENSRFTTSNERGGRIQRKCLACERQQNERKREKRKGVAA